MAHYIKCMLIGIWLSVFAVSVQAQGYRQLVREDFQGQPDKEDPYLSQTQLRFGYRYTTQQTAKSFRLVFQVYLDINPKASWMKFDRIRNEETLKDLLNHEQGHFKIGALMQRDLQRKLESFRYSARYKREADSIFQKVYRQYQRIQLQYDQETQHMMRKEKQKQWDALLDRAMQTGVLKLSSLPQFHFKNQWPIFTG